MFIIWKGMNKGDRTMDARIRYTKGAIRTTFISLLKEKPIEKITVKEICEKADINRATFYRYYENPYDLLEKLEGETMDNLQERILKYKGTKNKVQLGPEEELGEIFKIVLNDIIDKKDLYMTLFSENGDDLFKERLFSLCYKDNIVTIEKRFPNLSKEKQELLYYFVAEGCNGVLNQWLVNENGQTIDDLARFLVTTIASINSMTML